MNRSGSVEVPVRRAGAAGSESDAIAVEEPLLIRLEWPGGERAIAVTMRTPGNDAELAAGFLFGEGMLPAAAAGIDVTASTEEAGDVVTVSLREPPGNDLLKHERNFYMTSSCGICGKAALEAVRTRAGFELEAAGFAINGSGVNGLPAALLSHQALFAGTGSIHAAGLFDAAGNVVSVYEDVGRHNAVDKLIGRAWLDGDVPLADHGIVVSGRASFELVQKACMAGCPVLAAVGAPSSLAVELAWEAGMTLVGFVREQRFNVYSVPARITDLS